MSEQGSIGGAPEAVRDGELDLRAVGKALARKKWWVIGPALAVAAFALVGVNLVTPKYKSEARILIEGRENVFLRPEGEKADQRDRTVDEQAVTSQVQLALSRDLARGVIKQLKLGELPEFDPALRGVSLMRYSLGFLGLAKDPLRMTPEERVLEAYFERLAVFPVEKSRVIAVEFQSADPELAAQIANAIAENYLVFQQNARQDQTRAAGRWLSGEIDNLRAKVAEAEGKVEDFRSKANLFVGTNNTTLSSQTLGESNRELAAARSQKADLESKAQFIRDLLKKGAPIESSEFINSELIRRLNEQRVTLRAQLAEQSSTLLDNHPRIKELKAQIGDLDRQIRDEAARLARSYEIDARMANARVESLSSGLDQLKRQAASNNGQDVELRALEREAKALRDLLESYLAKSREASARDSLGAAPSDARVISRAVVSNTPYFPKKLPIVLIATLATLFLTAGFIATGELLAGNVYRAGGVVIELSEDRPGFFAASADAGANAIAHDGAARRAVAPSTAEPQVAHDAVPEIAPPSDVTVADVAQAVRDAGEAGKRIAVIGAEREVGAALTAIGLARALAREARVILVDLALDEPCLSAIAADPRSPGIGDLVRGAASFGQIITRDRYSRVQLVQAGDAAGNPAAIIDSERLTIAMDALSRTYDHVVINAGAAGELSSERVARLAPCALLVATGIAAADAEALRDQLANAGFTDVAVFTGMIPELDARGRVAA
ncbi:MAG: tyrosine-protein kinase Etk/Wzc [Hyphomicrobiales bacterium]|nr:tyrosine-protein kinase Etk/Wzc [Hyphomicrobiales bacterium]